MNIADEFLKMPSWRCPPERADCMKREKNHIDLVLFIIVLFLMIMSLGVVYSASSTWSMVKTGESGTLLGRHSLKIIAGMVALLLFMHIDYHLYRKISKPGLIVAVGLLVLTLVFGGEVNGAVRWMRFGAVGVQPSEFAKYALLFHLCVLIATKRDGIRIWKTGYVPLLVWIVLVTGLVLVQPNFSSGAVIFALSLAVLFLGRAKLSHLGLTLAMLLPLLVFFMIQAGYRKSRLLSFLGGSGWGFVKPNYQLEQGIIGFGSGGVFGLGPGGSRQRDLFLPESYGDFVFSVIGEEYGLIGTLFFLTLFMVICLRGVRIARHAPDELGRMLAMGITVSVTLYAIVNAAVTLGMLPTTGLPMPFVSYGGSSILFSSIAVGVLLNISRQTDLYPRVGGIPDGVRPLEPLRAAVPGRGS
jgi:cell division protein FtsW